MTDSLPLAGILFDVDLTLTNSQRQVSPAVQEALAALATRQLPIGVCTGRTYVSLQQTILPLFPAQSLHVVAGGSQLITKEGDVRWQQLLPAATVREITQLADQLGEMYYLATPQQGFGNARFIGRYQNLHHLIPPLRPVSELTTWAVPALVCVNVSPDFLAQLQRRTDITLKTSLSTQNFVSLDITPVGITKASGVQAWCQHLDISPAQVIGIGDSDNDREFLAAVGTAVAMGNSTPAVQALADEVIGDTDADGLAVYLQRVLKML